MQESHMKSIASYHSSESCLDYLQGSGEALTGESTGAVLSSEITSFEGRPRWMRGKATSGIPQRRGMIGFGGVRDLQHVRTLSARESGDPASSLTKGKR